MTKMYALILTVSVIFLYAGLLCVVAKAHDDLTGDPRRVNMDALLLAIKSVENTSQQVVGAAGERSEYQITHGVWIEHSRVPFARASDNTAKAKTVAKGVARAHLQKIVRLLPRLSYSPTAYNLSLVWKAGYERCFQGRPRFVDVEYAQRVQNVYDDILK